MAWPPKAPRAKGRPRAEDNGRGETAAQGEVAALAGAGDRADAQRLSGFDGEGTAMGLRDPVEARGHRGPGERHGGGGVEPQGRPRHGEFEGAGIGRIAHEGVGVAERARIHRPARWHAHMPEADAAGQFLQARLRAGDQHLDAARRIGEVAQRRGGDPARGEEIGTGDGAQIIEIGLDPRDRAVVEGLAQRGERRRAILAGHDDLGEHRVVVRGDLGAGLDPTVDAGLGREPHFGEEAGARGEIGVRDLGIEPRFHGGTLRDQGAGGTDHVLARRLADHPFDEIDAEHRLGDWVLDLEPSVHFKEGEILADGIVDILHRPRRGVGDARPQSHRGRVEACAHRIRQARRRGLLDDLLVAALERAIALAKRHHAAGTIAEDLHLHVARLADEALEIDAGIAEARPRRALDTGIVLAQLLGRGAQTHADAAATGGALEHHRITDGLGRREGGVQIRQQAGAGQEGHAAGAGEVARGVLEAEGAQVLGFRADEDDALRRQTLGEGHVLRQEAVAGMDGLRSPSPCRRRSPPRRSGSFPPPVRVRAGQPRPPPARRG